MPRGLKPEHYEQLPGWRKLAGGPWTIGYGHADGSVRPGDVCTKAEADVILRKDANAACDALDRRLPWWREMDPVRQDALADMCFNLGVTKLLGFRNTLRLLQDGQYEDAAAEALKSRWAAQTGDRARRIAHMLRTGARP
jgi:lysozyme